MHFFFLKFLFLDFVLTLIKFSFSLQPFGLYKGLLMPLLSAGVLNSIFFGCYGNMVRLFAHLRDERPKRTCCDNIEKRPTYKGFHTDIFCAGAIGGFVTTLVACPFELAKIKLQTQFGKLLLLIFF